MFTMVDDGNGDVYEFPEAVPQSASRTSRYPHGNIITISLLYSMY